MPIWIYLGFSPSKQRISDVITSVTFRIAELIFAFGVQLIYGWKIWWSCFKVNKNQDKFKFYHYMNMFTVHCTVVPHYKYNWVKEVIIFCFSQKNCNWEGSVMAGLPSKGKCEWTTITDISLVQKSECRTCTIFQNFDGTEIRNGEGEKFDQKNALESIE